MRSVLAMCAALAVVPLSAQPVITPGGVVNAASYSAAGLPNSAIAQGSIFIVFGKNLGPATIATWSSFPLSTTMAGTSASVTVNGTTVSPLMIYTSAGQVAMLMPSSTPVGSGTITIAYNNQTSAPVAVEVTTASFGIFAVNVGGSGPAVVTDANYGLISLTHSANPGQTLVLWGTGLGKISADETQAPPAGNVGTKPTVWVGSEPANVRYWGRSPCCGGLDQINFDVPAGVTGCYVPIAVQTGSTVSNFGSIAVAGTGSVCSDPSGLTSTELSLIQSGQDLGVATVSLSRSIVTLALPSPLPTTTTTTDSGSASFLRYSPTQLLSSNFGQAVSVGGCMVFPLLNGSATVTDPIQPVGLDAGAVIGVGGINGTVNLHAVPSSKGYYTGALGSSTNGPLYLDVAAHTIDGFGGSDIGPFSQEVQMPPALTWSNESSISTVSESQGVTVNWTNAVPRGYVRITGYSLSADNSGNLGAGASFICTANAGSNGTGQFTVPPAVLLNLPVSAAGSSTPSGFLGISSSLTPSDVLSGVRGIDISFFQTSVQVLKNVTYAQ